MTPTQRKAMQDALDALEVGDQFNPGLARVTLRNALAEPAPEPVPPFGSKRKAAMAVYAPPFRFKAGYIFDSQNLMVADDGDKVEGAVASRVRGWGRLGYLPNGAELQDEIGRMMADALNAYYAATVREPAPEQEPADIDQIGAGRYKVVPAHESVFHRWAVVAGDGTQQLYLGREIECQNMARKFAGAFLDGAYLATRQAQQPAPVPLLTDEEIAANASRHWSEDGVDPVAFGRTIEALVRQKAGLNWGARHQTQDEHAKNLQARAALDRMPIAPPPGD